MRTFIAIDLSQEIKNRLTAAVKQLKPLATGIKWVAPENYHLTLKFMGEVAESRIEDIKAILDNLSGKYQKFNLVARGTGSFPPGQSRMRVIWVGLEAGPELFSIQAELEEALSQQGFEKEERPFSPHLTIGRAREPQRQDRLKAELDRLGQQEFGSMEVKEIELFQSILRPEGPEYRIISRHYLK
ncbi:MAG: 2'-5' RNA ligase [Candidatus Saccharicenans subterraneus]|uniref:RNA 2',3'-cyclic phosphodiesterase n=1 Tax=Candidatus Saccharicenans subterraneus TaxID=2508984 RepID=A0A3E2BN78_9BACT|nr:MAG: 2'-5' RNA ligase [Candidatus Saccharicenans subterraneum]